MLSVCSQGCSKAMMGAVTLNSLLASCRPVPHSAGKEDMPIDFGHDYFHEVSNHGEALWYVIRASVVGLSSL